MGQCGSDTFFSQDCILKLVQNAVDTNLRIKTFFRTLFGNRSHAALLQRVVKSDMWHRINLYHEFLSFFVVWAVPFQSIWQQLLRCDRSSETSMKQWSFLIKLCEFNVFSSRYKIKFFEWHWIQCQQISILFLFITLCHSLPLFRVCQ